MYRLTVLVLLSFLLAGCGSRVEREAPRTGARLSETAQLAGTSPLEPAAANLLSAARTAPTDQLPPLPPTDSRTAQVIVDSTLDGTGSFQAANDTDFGNSKQLASAAGGVAYAIYQFSGIGVNDDLQRLTVNTSGHGFSGAAPGYWLGLADFTQGRWKTLARTQAGSYSQPLLITHPYLSESGSVYLFVLVEGGQLVTVDSVSLRFDDLEDPDWTVVKLEEGNVGWSPSIALDNFGSPWIVHVDRGQQTPRFAWGLSTDNLAVVDNWARGYMVTAGQGGPPRLDLDIDWTDVVIDPRVNLPVASFNYVNIDGGGALDSQAGLGVFHVPATGPPLWLYYFVGSGGEHGGTMAGARYTSIDFDPISQRVGVATSVENAGLAESNPNDVYVRYFTLNRDSVPSIPDIDTFTSFGTDLNFPHLRFSTREEFTQVLVSGNRFLLNQIPSPDWSTFIDETDTNKFGSLAYNQLTAGQPVYGVTYARDQGEFRRFYYSTYVDEERPGAAEVVDSIALGDGQWIGGASQLAYTYLGQPVIAYTVHRNDGVHVRYATRVDGVWEVETVSITPSATTSPQAVLVDIATEPLAFSGDVPRTNKVWLVWNQVGGASSSALMAGQRSLLD